MKKKQQRSTYKEAVPQFGQKFLGIFRIISNKLRHSRPTIKNSKKNGHPKLG